MAKPNEEPYSLSLDDLDNIVVSEDKAAAGRKKREAAEAKEAAGGRPRGPAKVYAGVKLRKNRKRPRSGAQAYGERRKRGTVASTVAAGGRLEDLAVEDLPQSKIDPLTGKLKVAAPKSRTFGTEGQYLEALDRHVTGKNGSDASTAHSHPWTLAHVYDPTTDMSIRADYRANLKVNPADGSRTSHSIKERAHRVVSVLKAMNPANRYHAAPVVEEHRWEIWSSPSTCRDCDPSRARVKFPQPPAVAGEPAAANLADPRFKEAVRSVNPAPVVAAPVAKPAAAPRRAAKPPYKPKSASKKAQESRARTDNKLAELEKSLGTKVNKSSYLDEFQAGHQKTVDKRNDSGEQA